MLTNLLRTKRKLLGIVLGIIVNSSSLFCQTIGGVEVFWNEDPGIGKGVYSQMSSTQSSLDTTIYVPVDGLSLGGHVLGIRIQSNSGFWSLTHYRAFFLQKIPQWNPLTLEWFFDEDPGVGNSEFKKILSVSSNGLDSLLLLELGEVPFGVHQLGMRLQQADGTWGHTHFRTLLFQPPKADIVRLEYFWDSDPGIGKGDFFPVSPLPSIDVTESVDGFGKNLSANTLFFRAYDSNGAVSHSKAVGQYEATDSIDLAIYPNPVSTEEVWIEGYVGTNQPIEITLGNMLGVTLKRISLLPEETDFLYLLEVRDLVAGIYWLTVRQGFTTYVQRLIIATE